MTPVYYSAKYVTLQVLQSGTAHLLRTSNIQYLPVRFLLRLKRSLLNVIILIARFAFTGQLKHCELNDCFSFPLWHLLQLKKLFQWKEVKISQPRNKQNHLLPDAKNSQIICEILNDKTIPIEILLRFLPSKIFF